MKKRIVTIVLLLIAIVYLRRQDKALETVASLRHSRDKISKINLNLEPASESEIISGTELTNFELNHETKLEENLPDDPDVVAENNFTYIRKQRDPAENDQEHEKCQYEVEPEPQLVQSFFVSNEKQIRLSLNQDSQLHVLLDMIDEYILRENNPYLTQELGYNCRIDITRIYILDELENLAEPVTST